MACFFMRVLPCSSSHVPLTFCEVDTVLNEQSVGSSPQVFTISWRFKDPERWWEMASVMQKMAPGRRLAPHVLMTSQRFFPDMTLIWGWGTGSLLTASVLWSAWSSIYKNRVQPNWVDVPWGTSNSPHRESTKDAHSINFVPHHQPFCPTLRPQQYNFVPGRVEPQLSSHLLFQLPWKAYCSGLHVQYLQDFSINRDHPALCCSAAHSLKLHPHPGL